MLLLWSESPSPVPFVSTAASNKPTARQEAKFCSPMRKVPCKGMGPSLWKERMMRQQQLSMFLSLLSPSSVESGDVTANILLKICGQMILTETYQCLTLEHSAGLISWSKWSLSLVIFVAISVIQFFPHQGHACHHQWRSSKPKMICYFLASC